MAEIRVKPGSNVKVKSSGVLGTVLHTAPVRVPGKRGRPATAVYVIHEDSTEGQYGVKELQLV